MYYTKLLARHVWHCISSLLELKVYTKPGSRHLPTSLPTRDLLPQKTCRISHITTRAVLNSTASWSAPHLSERREDDLLQGLFSQAGCLQHSGPSWLCIRHPDRPELHARVTATSKKRVLAAAYEQFAQQREKKRGSASQTSMSISRYSLDSYCDTTPYYTILQRLISGFKIRYARAAFGIIDGSKRHQHCNLTFRSSSQALSRAGYGQGIAEPAGAPEPASEYSEYSRRKRDADGCARCRSQRPHFHDFVNDSRVNGLD